MSSHLMKRFGLFFCFFVCALKPFSAETYDLLSCKESLQIDYDDIISLTDFLYFLVDFEIYSTVDFVQLKEEGLPDGVPEKPLRAYPSFKRDWSNVWRRVNKIRDQDQRKKQVLALIDKNPRMSITSMAQAMNTTVGIVQHTVIKLKGAGQIARIGSSKSGYWEILEDGAEPSPDPMEKKKEQILTLMVQNPRVTIAEIANIINTPSQTTRYIINKLKRAGKLARIGFSQNGYWEVLEDGAEPSPDPMKQRQERVLELIRENPRITVAEIAQAMNITLQTAQYAVNKLKEVGKLAHIGSPKSGYWEVLEDGAEPSPDPIEKKKEQVLALIEENPRITTAEIANTISTSLQTARYIINKLKEAGKLARIGFFHSGYWEVLEDGAEPSPDPMKQRQARILKLIRENPRITVAEIAQVMNITLQMAQYAVNKLKEARKLARIGYSKSGYWEILEESTTHLSPTPTEKKKEQVLALIEENPRITVVEIAHGMNAIPESIRYAVDKLKEEGQIARIGSSRNGFWQKMDNGAELLPNPMEQRKEQILAFIDENPSIKVAEIAQAMQLSVEVIHYTTGVLKKEGRLARIGPSGSGFWQRLEKDTQPAQDPINQKKEQILALFTENPYINIKEIIEITDFTKPVIERAIRILKEEKRLARIGSVKSGYWEVLENGAEPSPDPVKQQKEQILALVAEDPYITIAEIASDIGLTREVTSTLINKLRNEKKLARIGSPRGGFWETLADEAEPSPDPMEKKKEKILALTAENPYISLAEIAHAMGGLLKQEAKKIIHALKKAGQLARIGSSRNGFWEVLEKGAKPSGKDPIEQRKEKILNLIKENNKITLAQMAQTLKVSALPIRRAIDQLKNAGRLLRIGSTTNGHWEITESVGAD